MIFIVLMAPIIFYIFVPVFSLFTLFDTLVRNLNFSAWVNTCSHVGVSEAADRGDVTLSHGKIQRDEQAWDE